MLRRLILTSIAASAIVFGLAINAWAWKSEDMNVVIDQTNFVVNDGCSGTLIDAKQRYVLTADHCVDAQYETVVVEKVGDDGVVKEEKIRRLKPGAVRQISFEGAAEVREVTYRTKLVSIDRVKDLALLQIISEIPDAKASATACKAPVRGDQVFIVGNPIGLYSSVTVGIVSSMQRTYDAINFGDGANNSQALMQVSGGIVGGNSGGAVYNADGAIVGVSVLAHRANEVLGFAVPLDVINEFLKAAKVNINCK